MPNENPAIGDVSSLFDGLRNNDRAARVRLLSELYERIQRLTAVMLRTFPIVRQRREVESVANDLVIKLMNVLDDPDLRLNDESDFFRMAAYKLRLLLIDEADKYRRRNARLASREMGDAGFDPAAADSLDPAAVAEWTEFHERVAALPPEERTVVEMHFLLNMPQAEVARILRWPPKQVSRRWLAACLKLADYLPAV